MITSSSKLSEITPLELAQFCAGCYAPPFTITTADGLWSTTIQECADGRVIGFRGTQGNRILEWLADGNVRMMEVSFGGRRCRVPRGLWFAFVAIRVRLLDFMNRNPGGRILWTGHSAGHNFAVWAAMDPQLNQQPHSFAVTFEGPRCFDRAGAALCNERVELIRYTNELDIVPHLPLPCPWSATSYWHAGEERYLTGNGMLVNPLKLVEMIQDARDFWTATASGRLALAELVKDHFISNDVRLLAALEESEKTGEFAS